MSAPVVCGPVSLIKIQEEGGPSLSTELDACVDGEGAGLRESCCVFVLTDQATQVGWMVRFVLLLTWRLGPVLSGAALLGQDSPPLAPCVIFCRPGAGVRPLNFLPQKLP